MTRKEVPIKDKLALTIEETAEYSNIGINRIRELAKLPNCSFILRVGGKLLIKRKEFEKYIERQIQI